ncbi:MAG: ribbon-helix-helix domain-containing protein [Halanaeroarchaeum sp.]
MSTLNVKIPDEMDEDIDAFLEDHPHYLNKSELVRDAVRHLLEEPRLTDRAREDIRVSREQIEQGQTVSLDDLE